MFFFCIYQRYWSRIETLLAFNYNKYKFFSASIAYFWTQTKKLYTKETHIFKIQSGVLNYIKKLIYDMTYVAELYAIWRENKFKILQEFLVKIKYNQHIPSIWKYGSFYVTNFVLHGKVNEYGSKYRLVDRLNCIILIVMLT